MLALLSFLSKVVCKSVIPDIGMSIKLLPVPANNVALTVPLTFNLFVKFVKVPIPTFPFDVIIIRDVEDEVADDV